MFDRDKILLFLLGIVGITTIISTNYFEQSIVVKENGSRIVISTDGGETEAHYSWKGIFYEQLA